MDKPIGWPDTGMLRQRNPMCAQRLQLEVTSENSSAYASMTAVARRQCVKPILAATLATG